MGGTDIQILESVPKVTSPSTKPIQATGPLPCRNTRPMYRYGQLSFFQVQEDVPCRQLPWHDGNFSKNCHLGIRSL